MENEAFAAFVGRIVRAHGRRIATEGDLDALRDLLRLQGELDEVLTDSVKGLHAEPWSYSWTQLAEVLGVTRQAARQRFGSS